MESVAINITGIEGMSMPEETDIPVTTDIGATDVTRDVDWDSESEEEDDDELDEPGAEILERLQKEIDIEYEYSYI